MQAEVSTEAILEKVCARLYNAAAAINNMDPFKDPMPEWHALNGIQKFNIREKIQPTLTACIPAVLEELPDPMDAYLKGYNDAKAELDTEDEV